MYMYIYIYIICLFVYFFMKTTCHCYCCRHHIDLSSVVEALSTLRPCNAAQFHAIIICRQVYSLP